MFRGSKILNRKPSLLLTLTRERAPLYQERKNGNAAVVQKEKVMIKSLTQPMTFDGKNTGGKREFSGGKGTLFKRLLSNSDKYWMKEDKKW